MKQFVDDHYCNLDVVDVGASGCSSRLINDDFFINTPSWTGLFKDCKRIYFTINKSPVPKVELDVPKNMSPPKSSVLSVADVSEHRHHEVDQVEFIFSFFKRKRNDPHYSGRTEKEKAHLRPQFISWGWTKPRLLFLIFTLFNLDLTTRMNLIKLDGSN